MDSQNNTQNTQPAPRRAYTAEEIARLEAEAVAAMQRGGAAPTRPSEAAPTEAEGAAEAREASAPEPPAFVPYVDDVPEPEVAAEDDDDDEPYVPGAMEKRIDDMKPEQWRLWQIVGGAAVGLAAIACLFVFGEELATYGLIVAALLAILLPRYLERAWRHRLTVARYAMIGGMLVGLAVMAAVIFMRQRGLG